MLIDICLPAHNESKIIKNNVLKLLNYLKTQNFDFDWKIIIIFNGSTDNSLAIAQDLAKQYLEINVRNITEPLFGKSSALRIYFFESSADIITFMDIDLAVSLDNFSNLILPIINKQFDMTYGSRIIKGAKVERSFFRTIISWGYIYMSRFILSHNFSDLQCGFKAFKRTVWEKIGPFTTYSYGFLDTELIILAYTFKFRIKEIPVDWKNSRFDKRTSRFSIIKAIVEFIQQSVAFKKRLRKIVKANLKNIYMLNL